jgi:hypothetical protein
MGLCKKYLDIVFSCLIHISLSKELYALVKNYLLFAILHFIKLIYSMGLSVVNMSIESYVIDYIFKIIEREA